MVYLRSVLFGIAGALVAAVLWVLAAFVLPIVLPTLLSRMSGDGAGSSGAVIGSGSVLIAALVGFAAGCYCGFTR
jgi:hypothetical protein